MFPRLKFGLEYKMILVRRRPGQHFHLESKATRRPRLGESSEARLHMARGNGRKRPVYSGFVV